MKSRIKFFLIAMAAACGGAAFLAPADEPAAAGDASSKPKVCFVRDGGPPLTEAGLPPFIPGGPISTIAKKLRECNFEVSEKDLSGQWAMPPKEPRPPSAPEASDDTMRDAIWVVIDLAQDRPPQGAAPPLSAIAPKLKEHLAHGGSALILADIRSDNLAGALKDWGIDLHTDALAVHETIKVTDAAAADPIEEAKTRPFVWDIRKYGDHPLVAPLNNLDSVLVAPIVVNTRDTKDCTITKILPFTENMPGLKTWGDANIEQLQQGKDPEYHPEKGDFAPPIYGGAVVEKQGAGRLVVIGSMRLFSNACLRIYDPAALRHDPPVQVNRFPGNEQLAINSLYWLARLETKIVARPAPAEKPNR